MHRREFLESAALVGLPLVAGRSGAADTTPTDAVAFPGMIVREREPLNLEYPFSSLDRFVLPTERFFIRRHFARPKIDLTTWKLRVDGHVARPLEVSLDDLRTMRSQTRAVALQCAGHARLSVDRNVRGVAW